jgi:sulfopyruvate decarboxylase subunit alpha
VSTIGQGQASQDAPSTNYAELIIRGLKEAHVEIVASLPESLLKELYPMLQNDKQIRYIRVSSETDLPGIVAGAYFGGKRAVMIMENSGVRQACEPLARLIFGHRIPMVMIMPHRGDLGEDVWWGHGHSETMVPILDALRIRHWSVNRLDEIVPSIKKSMIHADAGQVAVALIFGGECREAPSYA